MINALVKEKDHDHDVRNNKPKNGLYDEVRAKRNRAFDITANPEEVIGPRRSQGYNGENQNVLYGHEACIAGAESNMGQSGGIPKVWRNIKGSPTRHVPDPREDLYRDGYPRILKESFWRNASKDSRHSRPAKP